MTTDLPIRRALISVSDKTGLLPLAQALAGRGVEILSTGGTARQLREAGIAIREVSEVTAFPEIMDGRVKTLHPRIHGGLLARRDQPHHRAAAEEHGIPMIDLLVVNLYPFEETIAGEAEFAEAIENIDIGGPAMIRAAAKNHAHVAVVTDPDDYEAVIAALEARDGAVDADLRRRLAATAFARTAAYDAAIATWFAGELGEDLGRRYFLAGSRRQALRYGENPHQQAALYVTEPEVAGVARATQVQGKELSYNNLNDTDAAWAIAAEPDRPCAVIVKHANPCGVAEADGLADAYRKALAADPVSAFGGIVALNRPLDGETAAELAKIFTEVIIAPEADAEAREVLSAKQNLRLLITGQPPRAGQHRMDVRTIGGGFLVQSHDIGRVEAADLKVVTERAPSAAEMADLLFAFRIVKHVKSNAILFARHGATLGIGAGQMSRVDSVRLAVEKARQTAEGAAPPCHGSVVASDAFFPFADGLIAAAEAGATAAIHPGGSKRDQEVIDAANERGMAMVVTGMRHFRH